MTKLSHDAFDQFLQARNAIISDAVKDFGAHMNVVLCILTNSFLSENSVVWVSTYQGDGKRVTTQEFDKKIMIFRFFSEITAKKFVRISGIVKIENAWYPVTNGTQA